MKRLNRRHPKIPPRIWQYSRTVVENIAPLSGRRSNAGENVREKPNTYACHRRLQDYRLSRWKKNYYSHLYAKPMATITCRALRDKYDIIASAGQDTAVIVLCLSVKRIIIMRTVSVEMRFGILTPSGSGYALRGITHYCVKHTYRYLYYIYILRSGYIGTSI